MQQLLVEGSSVSVSCHPASVETGSGAALTWQQSLPTMQRGSSAGAIPNGVWGTCSQFFRVPAIGPRDNAPKMGEGLSWRTTSFVDPLFSTSADATLPPPPPQGGSETPRGTWRSGIYSLCDAWLLRGLIHDKCSAHFWRIGLEKGI